MPDFLQSVSKILIIIGQAVYQSGSPKGGRREGQRQREGEQKMYFKKLSPAVVEAGQAPDLMREASGQSPRRELPSADGIPSGLEEVF